MRWRWRCGARAAAGERGASGRAFGELDGAVAEHGGTDLLADVELPLVQLLARMETTGIAVDTEHLERAVARVHQLIRAETAQGVPARRIVLGGFSLVVLYTVGVLCFAFRYLPERAAGPEQPQGPLGGVQRSQKSMDVHFRKT